MHLFVQSGRSSKLRAALCILLLLCIVAAVLVSNADVPLRRTRTFRVNSFATTPLALLGSGFAVVPDSSQFELLANLGCCPPPGASHAFLSNVLIC